MQDADVLDVGWGTSSATLSDRSRQSLLSRIESIAQSLSLALLERDGELVISLLRRRGRRGRFQDTSDAARARVQFPGSNAQDAWRFTVTLRLLDLVHEALSSNIVVSKRDIYYRDPALFVTQANVDRYLEDIAWTLRVDRSSLNVTAVSKGLIFGSATLHFRDGSQRSIDNDREDVLVADLRDLTTINLSRVRWILVIEKEATFRACVTILCSFADSAGGLLVTAKGYPDKSTKDFLRMLASPSSQNGYNSMPLYMLVDYDPDGYGIYSCFNWAVTTPGHASSVACLGIRMLGLTFDQLRICSTSADRVPDGVLAMTARDRVRARNMLEHDSATDADSIRTEIQRMLCLNAKAELQHLSEFDDALLNLMTSDISEWQDAVP